MAGDVVWRRPSYATIHRMSENPIYGGAPLYRHLGTLWRGDTDRTALCNLNGETILRPDRATSQIAGRGADRELSFGEGLS